MDKQKWLIRGALGLWVGLWFGVGAANAGVIFPTDPGTGELNVTSSVTVSIYELDSAIASTVPTVGSASMCYHNPPNSSYYLDVTNCWLPEWTTAGGQEVYVVINGSPDTPSLVLPPMAPYVANLTTSAYPGNCTNLGSDAGPDYSLGPAVTLPTSATTSVTGYLLTPNDCGGMAVIQVGMYKFILPQDGTVSIAANGIPEIWENLFGGNLNGQSDGEHTGANPYEGDGLATMDEWRGFIVNGTQIRTDPTQKDLFVHLFNPQCPGNGSSLLNIYPTDGSSVFANLYNLGGTATPLVYHFLNYQDRADNGPASEWIDNLVSYNIANPDFVFSSPDGRIDDRSVNMNAIYPSGDPANQLIHKGVRIIECLNTLYGALGVAFFPGQVTEGSPDLDTNTVIYTQRIYADYANLLNHSSSKGGGSSYQSCALDSTCVYYSTYPSNSSSPTEPTDIYVDTMNVTHTVDRDYIVSKYIQFVLGMELAHDLYLIPVIHISDYGPHYAPESGDILDQRIVAKDSKKQKGVIYYIPTAFNDKDNGGFQLHN